MKKSANEDALLTAALRDALGQLADSIFPLSDWVSSHPGRNANAPWRNGDGPPLSAASLGLIDYFESLLRDSGPDRQIRRRMDQVRVDPSMFFPESSMAAWRATRGLNASPVFAADQSDSVLTDRHETPISRMEFYLPYWPKLLSTVDIVNPQNAEDWKALAQKLLNDTCFEWQLPLLLVHKPASSLFMTQFSKDLLQGMLGLHGFAPEPYDAAVLEELGEYRRSGDSHLSKDVDTLREALLKKIEKQERAASANAH